MELHKSEQKILLVIFNAFRKSHTKSGSDLKSLPGSLVPALGLACGHGHVLCQ